MANETTRTPQQQDKQRQQQSPQQQNAQRGAPAGAASLRSARSTGEKHRDQGQSSLNKDDQGRSQS
jgi:hypothetical protein